MRPCLVAPAAGGIQYSAPDGRRVANWRLRLRPARRQRGGRHLAGADGVCRTGL